MRRSSLLIAGALLVMCAGTASAELRKVTIDSGRYSPSEIVVNVGDVIRFTNVSRIDHTVTSYNPRFNKDVGLFFDTVLAPGASYDWTVPAPRPSDPGDGIKDGGIIACFCKGHQHINGERIFINVKVVSPGDAQAPKSPTPSPIPVSP